MRININIIYIVNISSDFCEIWFLWIEVLLQICPVIIKTKHYELSNNRVFKG